MDKISSSKNATKRPRRGSPVVVENAAGKVSIYATGLAYTLVWTAGGQRRREKRSTLVAAYGRARKILADLRTGTAHVRSFTIQQTATIDSAIEVLREIRVPLSSAARDYADAHKILGGRVSVVEAARAYMRHLDDHECKPIKVKELVEEFRASVKRRNLSGRYERDCRYHLGKLTGAVGTRQIRDLRAAEIETTLDKATKGGPRAFNNMRGTFGALFSYAQRRGYLPRDRKHEVSLIEPRQLRFRGQIAVYKPHEMRTLLEHADDRLLPLLVLGGLGGLRSMEICRITWDMIDFESGFIMMAKSFTKTRRRRVVPICPAMDSWLRPLRNEGFIYGFKDSSSLNRIAARHWPVDAEKKPRVVRRPNALRHSYGTYRFAQLRDEQKVSAEMGNSPQELREHYAELATPAQGDEWFAICRPPSEVGDGEAARTGPSALRVLEKLQRVACAVRDFGGMRKSA
jgi:integrase